MGVRATEYKSPYDISEYLEMPEPNDEILENKPVISYESGGKDQYHKPSITHQYSDYGDYTSLYDDVNYYNAQTSHLGEILSYVIIDGAPAGSSVIQGETNGSDILNDFANATSVRYTKSDVNFNGEPLHDAVLLLSSSRGNNILFSVETLIMKVEGLIAENEGKIINNQNRINECVQLIDNYQQALKHSWSDEHSESMYRAIQNLNSEIEALTKENTALEDDNKQLKKQLEEYKVDLLLFQELAKTLNNIYLKTQSAEEALADLYNGVYGSLANSTNYEGLKYTIYSFSQKGYEKDGEKNPWDYFQSGWEKEIKEKGCGPTSLASCLSTLLQNPSIIPSVLASSLTSSTDNNNWTYLKAIDEMNEKNNLGIYYAQDGKQYGRSKKDENGDYVLKTFLDNGGKMIFTLKQDSGGHYMSLLGSNGDNVIICDSQGGMNYYNSSDGGSYQTSAGVPFEVSFDDFMKYWNTAEVSWIADRPIEEVMGLTTES